MTDRLRVGVISSVHGIHGECKVYPTTDDPQRFKMLKKVYAVSERGDTRELEIDRVRFFKNMVICGFKEITTPEEMQKLRGRDIYIDRKDAMPLEEGEYYIADLIGLKVIDEDDTVIGTVEDIFPTGANQVMEVKTPEGREVLIPYIPVCILKVFPEEGFIRVHMIPGLMDL